MRKSAPQNEDAVSSYKNPAIFRIHESNAEHMVTTHEDTEREGVIGSCASAIPRSS